ncbi:MAG: deoxynucleoside kinase [Deltaproteobacteria bacterium]|nr:deoxynucleoside kinase [Deltaproteobacteria bacterium]
MRPKPRYIAVAGNMGSGKSSLVAWLRQQFDLVPFFEGQAANPYLEDFYADMGAHAFRSQLHFMFHRYAQHRLLEREQRGVVQDRTLYEDAEIFARNLHDEGFIDDRDWGLYRLAYGTLAAELRPPDLLIYLRCSMRTLRKRIRLRGRAYESSLPMPYLRRLERLYEEWFETWDRCPTLVLETDELDYVEDLFSRRDLLETLRGVLGIKAP